MTNIKKIFTEKPWIILTSIFLLGLLLRLFNFHDTIIFAYDQARDAQRIYDIVHNFDIKLVGPETDIQGVFNGPLLYYLLAPVYAISNFDPNAGSLLFIFINLTGVFLLYQAAVVLFQNRNVGYIAAFLWAVSYQQLNYSRFISNASGMSISSIIFFLGLAIYIFRGKNYGLVISAIGLAFAIHFNFYLVYLAIFIPILYYLFFPKINVKWSLISLGTFLLLLSNFILSEILWKFAASKAFIEYFGHQTKPTGIIENLTRYAQKMSEAIYYSLFSFNNFLAFLVFCFFIYIVVRFTDNKKSLRFLLVWLFSTLPLFAFTSGVLTVSVINSTIFAPVLLIAAIAIYYLFTQKEYLPIAILILVVITLSNANLIAKDRVLAHSLFSEPVLLKDEKAMIDYTYNNSKKEPFSVCAVSNPLFINSLWSLLYSTYGKDTYGRLPFWSGQPQYLNKSLIPYDIDHVKTRYLILEPIAGIPDHAPKATLFLEDQVSLLEEEKQFGQFRIQKRYLEKDTSLLTDTQHLVPQDIILLQKITKIDPRYSCYTSY